MAEELSYSTFSAKDAKTRFGEMLDEALSRPVGITKHDRLTAFVISRREFEAMNRKLSELEDKLWLAKAEIARLGGYASEGEVETFLKDFRSADDEKT